MSEIKGDVNYLNKCTAIFESPTGKSYVWVTCAQRCDGCGFSKDEIKRRKSLIEYNGLDEKERVLIRKDGSKTRRKLRGLNISKELCDEKET